MSTKNINLIKRIIFLHIFCVGFNLCGQKNPGYLGKKNVFSVSTTLFPFTLVDYGQSVPAFGLSFERSIFRNLSLELSYSGYSMSENEKLLHKNDYLSSTADYYKYQDGPNQNPGQVNGSGKTNHQNFGIVIKNYIQNKGAIAPLGSYVGIKIQKCSWQHIASNYSSYHLNINQDTINDVNSIKPSSQSITTLSILIGRKTEVFKGFTFGYSFGSGIAISPYLNYIERGYYYGNPSNYINAVLQRHVSACTFMELKFELGYVF